MKIPFGKHQGASVERLFLREPDYIRWLLKQKPSGQMYDVQRYALQLISKLNKKPITIGCSGKGCNKLATYYTVYSENIHLVYWWCNDCDPIQLGASPSKIQSLQTYKDALTHVDSYCRGKKSALKALIKTMAEARGLHGRVTDKKAEDFFK